MWSGSAEGMIPLPPPPPTIPTYHHQPPPPPNTIPHQTRYNPICTDSTSTSRVKIQKEEEILSFWKFSLAYSKAIIPPSHVEFQIMKVHNVTGLTLDIPFLPSHIRVLLHVQTKYKDEDKQK